MTCFYKLCFSLMFGLIFASSCSQSTVDPPPPPPAEVDSLQLYRETFVDPQVCASCHPNHYDEWQTSMHAYALNDPIFLKLNKIGQERSNNELDQFCIKCHSPFAPLLQETPPTGFDHANLSGIVKASVSCDACHVMDLSKVKRGEGVGNFHLDRVRRATIADPQENSFHESAFDNAYSFSDFCSPCHDLKSPDLSLTLEATNTEWDESPYIAMGLECQDCHMPSYSGFAATGGPQRDVHRHRFIGVDYPLVDFPGKAETIRQVGELLKNSATMTVTLPQSIAAGDTFSVNVRIKNDRTGHSIPSGSVFERQMWLEVIVKDLLTNQIYFSSGLLDANDDLMDHHSEFVANNLVPEDTALVLFTGKALDANGKESLFFWEAKSIEVNTIEAFGSAFANYHLSAPNSSANVEVSVRLRFRSFPPYLFRAIEEEALVQELIVFDMAEFSGVIPVH